MTWLLNRLKEKSTWIAIFTLAGLVGIKIDPELREHIINAILAVAAVAAFVFRENTRERSTDPEQSPPRTLPLPPIELTAKSESAEVPNIPPMAFDDSAPHNRRVTDAWMRDPVPSVPGFKVPPTTHGGQVGWNDDH